MVLRGVLASTVAVGLAGGVGVSAAPGRGGTSASKSTYIRSADRVCRKHDRKIAAIPAPPTGSPIADRKKYEAWGTRARGVFTAYDAALRGLRSPSSAARFVAAWRKAKRTADAYIRTYVRYGMFASRRPEARSLIRANKRFGKVAAAYGFADCGRRFRAGKLPH